MSSRTWVEKQFRGGRGRDTLSESWCSVVERMFSRTWVEKKFFGALTSRSRNDRKVDAVGTTMFALFTNI